jgi:signal recognition particle receptor subunit alpha
MLEAVQIFTKGGLILFSWSLGLAAVKGNPVDALIRTCLLEERSGTSRPAQRRGRRPTPRLRVQGARHRAQG